MRSIVIRVKKGRGNKKNISRNDDKIKLLLVKLLLSVFVHSDDNIFIDRYEIVTCGCKWQPYEGISMTGNFDR